MLSAVETIGALADRSGVQPVQGTAIADPATTTAFADVLAAVGGQAMRTMETAEATSIRAIHGQASMQDVVEAIISAEQTLQSAIAVRDRVVAAYQEISRMQI